MGQTNNKNMKDNITAYILLLEKERDDILLAINANDNCNEDSIIMYGKELEKISIKISALFIAKHNTT